MMKTMEKMGKVVKKVKMKMMVMVKKMIMKNLNLPAQKKRVEMTIIKVRLKIKRTLKHRKISGSDEENEEDNTVNQSKKPQKKIKPNKKQQKKNKIKLQFE